MRKPLSLGSKRFSTVGWIVLVGVVLFGVALRLVYYDNVHGQSDEAITVEVVWRMRQTGDWDVNWAKADLSPDLKYDQYNFSTHLYATYFFYRVVKLFPGTEPWWNQDRGVRGYRLFVALLGSVVVVQVVWIGWRVFGPLVAGGAGILTSVATLLVQDAHYNRPEALTTVLTLAAVAWCLPRERFSLGPILLAAFAVGLLIACKVSMLLLVWLPAVPVIVAWSEIRARRWVIVALATFLVLGFVTGAPGAFMHPAAYLHGVRALTTQYGGMHLPHSDPSGGPATMLLVRYFVATLGWPAIAAFGCGIGVLVVRRGWALAALLVGPVLVFGGFFTTRSVFFERNLSHVVPLFYLVAVYGAAALVARVARVSWRRATVVALGILTLFALRPVIFTWRLIQVEYAGRANAMHDQVEAEMAAKYRDAERWNAFLCTPEPLQHLETHFQTSAMPVLLRITDYADVGTRKNLAALLARFDARAVGDFPGTFPELPTCTLHTYHGAHDRYILVTGLRR